MRHRCKVALTMLDVRAQLLALVLFGSPDVGAEPAWLTYGSSAAHQLVVVNATGSVAVQVIVTSRPIVTTLARRLGKLALYTRGGSARSSRVGQGFSYLSLDRRQVWVHDGQRLSSIAEA